MSWPYLPGPPTPPVPPRTSVATHLFIAAGIGLMFGLFVFLARAPIPRAVGTGLVLAGGSFALLRAMEIGKIEWPAKPPSRSIRVSGIQRWRLNGFEALTDRRPNLSPDLRNRLRALASAILTRRQLTAGSANAVALLGADTHELLFPPPRIDGDPPPADPTAEQLTAMIDRLIDLGDSRSRPAAGHEVAADSPAAKMPPEGITR